MIENYKKLRNEWKQFRQKMTRKSKRNLYKDLDNSGRGFVPNREMKTRYKKDFDIEKYREIMKGD